MDFSQVSLFKVMGMKMKYHSAQQAEIAKNIANVDTPGYKATEVVQPDFKRALRGASAGTSLPMATTRSGHITGGSASVTFNVQKRENTYDLNPDGNNVSVEEEMMRASGNQAEYTKVLSLYRKTAQMFKTAIGSQGGGA